MRNSSPPTLRAVVEEQLARIQSARLAAEPAAEEKPPPPSVLLPGERADPLGEAAALLVPEPAPDSGPWQPNEGPQSEFLTTPAYEVLYGGAAGGGKSEGILLGALRYIAHSEYHAGLFRRTYPELETSLIPRSRLWYPKQGGRYNDSKHVWTFPSGARIRFGHLEYEDSVDQYQSSEFQYLGFDELTTFTRGQYTKMLARARSSAGIPVRVRSGTNPGGDGHDWVQQRWAPWLGAPPEVAWEGPSADAGKPLWYVNEEGGERYITLGEARALIRAWHAAPVERRPFLSLPLTRVFIPARVEDNPKLIRNDPAYVQRLMGLDPVRRAQLRSGDWAIRPAAGKYFQRGWIKMVDAPPKGPKRTCRHWDLAGTEPEDGADPDWTVGLKLSLTPDGKLCIEDVERGQWSPNTVEEKIADTAKADGREVEISLPQDPGQAGKFQAGYLVGKLQGYVVRAEPETGSKVERAGPISSQCEAKNVSMVRAPWNAAVLQVLERFPGKGKKDDVDALSGAHRHLVDTSPAGYGGLTKSGGSWGRGGR